MEIAVLTTVSDRESANRIARALVSEKLAACVNVIPGVTSFYEWDGSIQEENEIIILAKTENSVFEKMKKRVIDLHPYDLPELITLDISGGLPEYLEWIRKYVE